MPRPLAGRLVLMGLESPSKGSKALHADFSLRKHSVSPATGRSGVSKTTVLLCAVAEAGKYPTDQEKRRQFTPCLCCWCAPHSSGFRELSRRIRPSEGCGKALKSRDFRNHSTNIRANVILNEKNSQHSWLLLAKNQVTCAAAKSPVMLCCGNLCA